jgi:calcineurin-like phosphoesterase family protein
MNLPGVYDIFNKSWGDRQTCWIISDPHLGDEDLRAGIPNRPSDAEIIRRINAKCGRKDVLICLGDVGSIELAKQLRGYKVLICGNHDVGRTVYEEIFDEVYTGALMIGEKLLLSHEPVPAAWYTNLHGHDHAGAKRKGCINCCLDANGYEPINMNQLLKSGIYKDIESIHRITIDRATERKRKRGGRKIGR